MSSGSYTYLGTDFKNATNIRVDDIESLIRSSAIQTANLVNLLLTGEFPDCTLEVNFDNPLSSSDKDILDEIIESYIYQEITNIIFAIVYEKLNTGVDAGTFENNVWEIRNLNTLFDTVSFVELKNNQITLEAGSYIIKVSAPSYGVGPNKLRLYDVTNQIVVGEGQVSVSPENTLNYAELQLPLNINIDTTYEVQHICSTEVLDVGLGKAYSLGEDEIYTQVFINKR